MDYRTKRLIKMGNRVYLRAHREAQVEANNLRYLSIIEYLTKLNKCKLLNGNAFVRSFIKARLYGA